MSISTKLEPLADSPRIIINDAFMGDSGAAQLARFLANHQRVVSLQIKSNDISPEGFILIFKALQNNRNIRQINIQHNNLGVNDYIQWHDSLCSLIAFSPKLERLNLSNNKISSEGFSRLIQTLAESKSLKLLQIRYNNIGGEEIQLFANQLKRSSNQTLLYIQLTGNKPKKQTLATLQSILSKNRKKNPTTKQKLMGNVNYSDHLGQDDRSRTINHYNTPDQISNDHMIIYLEDILNQNRIQAAENKVRLENQLAQLQRRQKLDAAQLNQIQRKCGQVVILNRNLQFQLDRTLAEYQEIHRDQQSHLRVHEQKVRQASRQIQDLQSKYEDMQSRMNKQHEIKMKQIVRDWQARLRNVEQKIRNTEHENQTLEGEVKKHLDRRQRLRLECVDEENNVRVRVEGQEAAKYNLKIRQLQSKYRQLEDTRDGYIKRNQELIFQLEKSQIQNKKQIAELQEQYEQLKMKQSEFNAKSKDFFSKNQKIKSEIQMKQITIDKLEEQISRLDKQIENKRLSELEQTQKIRQEFQIKNLNKEESKKTRQQKLSDLQNALRNSQLQNAKLRQQYALLAQKLQVSLSMAVHTVFSQNSLF